jgi:hypothetical protein
MDGHRLAGTPAARVFQSVSRAAWNRPFAQLDAMERPKPVFRQGHFSEFGWVRFSVDLPSGMTISFAMPIFEVNTVLAQT